MQSELLVGVDLGTTALKAGLFDEHANLIASSERSYSIRRPHADQAEQDPAEWVDAFVSALSELEGAADGRTAAAIGVCSQVNSHVFVDATGSPLRPAIIWQDQRCSDVAQTLSGRLGVSVPDKAARFPLSSSSLPARAAWVAEEEPRVWEATRYVLSPKDFLNAWLCGVDRAATDPITPFDVVDDDGCYDADVIDLVDGLAERLPSIHAIDSTVGEVNRDLPLVAGATTVVGTMDAWGSVYGSGVTAAGDAMEVAGTSEILGLLSNTREQTAGVVSFLPVDGLYLHAGPTQAGGAALGWLCGLLRISVEEALAFAESAPPGSGGLIFAPHLLGERAPLWDADIRAAFIGLSSDHGTAHLCRAVLEGVAYSARHLLEALETAATTFPLELRASGGCAQSDLWCQIKADTFDTTVARLRIRHSGCVGAVLMAASGVGLATSVVKAAEENVHVERVFEPGPSREIYDELYGVYRALPDALRPTHAVLAAIRRAESAAPTREGSDL